MKNQPGQQPPVALMGALVQMAPPTKRTTLDLWCYCSPAHLLDLVWVKKRWCCLFGQPSTSPLKNFLYSEIPAAPWAAGGWSSLTRWIFSLTWQSSGCPGWLGAGISIFVLEKIRISFQGLHGSLRKFPVLFREGELFREMTLRKNFSERWHAADQVTNLDIERRVWREMPLQDRGKRQNRARLPCCFNDERNTLDLKETDGSCIALHCNSKCHCKLQVNFDFTWGQ